MVIKKMKYVVAGLLLGLVYFFAFERPNKDNITMECWQELHYTNKANSSLFMVHLKSILAGIIILLCAMYDYKVPIIILGSAIIGLHLGQWYVETKFISEIKSTQSYR